MKSRKYFYLTVGTIFFSLVLLQTAGAALRPSAWTLSPMAGAHFFSNDQLLEDATLYGLGIGYNFTERFATEAVISYAPTETASGVADDVDYTSIRLDLLYHFPLTGNFVPYVAAGAGEAFVSPDKIAGDKNAVVGYGAGAKYFINDALALRCDVRHLLDINDADAQRDQTVLNNYAVTAGLFLQFGGKEVMPVPPRDTDGDNVTDVVDQCPDTPFGVIVDEMGCPDRDGDGVVDNLDFCPDTAAGVAVDEKGCQVVLVIDKDQDGVVDAQDACPDTPAKTVVDARGCPVIVLPEPAMTFYLEYLPNESEVKNDFAAEMEKMADFVKANPGKRFVIEGHTDSVGSDTSNMRLSLLRAEKIKAYLSEKMGISASLLEARGFGESNPVADNNTQEGRRQNRRVVIIAFPQL